MVGLVSNTTVETVAQIIAYLGLAFIGLVALGEYWEATCSASGDC